MTTRVARRSRRRPLLLALGGLVAAAALVALLTAPGDGGGGEEPPQWGPVVLQGSPLPRLGSGPDPAIGMAAPVLEGVDVHRDPVVAPDGRPTLLVFLAHWCPHCQAEVPRVVAWRGQGGGPGLRVVAVSSGQDRSRPNWPATQWLEREGWMEPVLLDDEEGSAGRAYGLTSYPYFVLVNADGVVVARASGELSEDMLEALAERV